MNDVAWVGWLFQLWAVHADSDNRPRTDIKREVQPAVREVQNCAAR
jgi:hypothetical protein